MRLALREAHRAAGRTFPNPGVGAVVFRAGRVLGRGFTRPPGGPHAEIVALEAARRRDGARGLRGAELAVTLEPCCFTGRTGPCTEAILRAGIRRVWVGAGDPHPRVRGRGVAKLRAGGVRVATGVLEDACREHHRGFLSVHERGRPFVTLKLAATLDGRIATARGESRWISSPPARALVQRWRAAVDAILIGSGTVLADDPELAARRDGRVVHRPVRVVVDSGLRVGPSARLVRGARGAPTWLLCAPRPAARRRAALEARGARVLPVARRGARLDLRAALAALGREGITTLLCEGGAGLAAALLRAGLVDELHWFVAPRLLGCEGRAALGPLAVARLAGAVPLGRVAVTRVGPDLHVHARLDSAKLRA